MYIYTVTGGISGPEFFIVSVSEKWRKYCLAVHGTQFLLLWQLNYHQILTPLYALQNTIRYDSVISSRFIICLLSPIPNAFQYWWGYHCLFTMGMHTHFQLSSSSHQQVQLLLCRNGQACQSWTQQAPTNSAVIERYMNTPERYGT